MLFRCSISFPGRHHTYVSAIWVEQRRVAGVLEVTWRMQWGDVEFRESPHEGVQVRGGETELQEVVAPFRIYPGQVGRGLDGEIDGTESAGVVRGAAVV